MKKKTICRIPLYKWSFQLTVNAGILVVWWYLKKGSVQFDSPGKVAEVKFKNDLGVVVVLERYFRGFGLEPSKKVVVRRVGNGVVTERYLSLGWEVVWVAWLISAFSVVFVIVGTGVSVVVGPKKY